MDNAGASIPPEFVPPDTLKLLASGGYTRMVLTVNADTEGDAAFAPVSYTHLDRLELENLHAVLAEAQTRADALEEIVNYGREAAGTVSYTHLDVYKRQAW